MKTKNVLYLPAFRIKAILYDTNITFKFCKKSTTKKLLEIFKNKPIYYEFWHNFNRKIT